MNYIIGTGWWCDGTGKHAGSAGNSSSDRIRQVGFFSTWLRHVRAYTSPTDIVVVDSASPVRPDFSGLHVLRMIRNFTGDGRDGMFGTDRTAATRQVFVGAVYAAMNGADYFVWLEQDCLVHGKGLVERAIENMKGADFSTGRWDHEYRVETCFMIFKATSVATLIDRYFRVAAPKPELRYLELTKQLRFAWLPFGYGRNRPINFDDKQFYAQHLNDDEIRKFEEKLR